MYESRKPWAQAVALVSFFWEGQESIVELILQFCGELMLFGVEYNISTLDREIDRTPLSPECQFTELRTLSDHCFAHFPSC